MSARHIKKDKEKMEKKARERSRNLSKEEKDKKRKYGRKLYKNLPENEK